MRASRRRWLARVATATLGAALGERAFTAEPASASPAASASATPLEVSLVKTGLYLIQGGGANSLLRFTATGLVLVDGKSPGQYRPLVSQVRKINKISDLPLRALVLTNHRENRAGTTPDFLKAGVPVVAQTEVAKRLPLAASGADVPGLVRFELNERIRMGGVEVDVLHLGAGCTAGDTVVHFRDLRVLALGDLADEEISRLDYSDGGSLLGWARALAEVTRLDFEIAVPAEGPPKRKTDVFTFAARLDGFIAAARAVVREGKSRQDMASWLPASYPGWGSQLGGVTLDQMISELAH